MGHESVCIEIPILPPPGAPLKWLQKCGTGCGMCDTPDTLNTFMVKNHDFVGKLVNIAPTVRDVRNATKSNIEYHTLPSLSSLTKDLDDMLCKHQYPVIVAVQN